MAASLLEVTKTNTYSVRLELAKWIVENEKQAIEFADGDDVLMGAVYQLRTLLTVEGALSRYLNRLTRSVEDDLRRIYRYRNMFVHEAAQATDVARRLIDRLSFYWATTINGVLYGLRRAPKLTVEEVLTNRQQSYAAYITMIDNSTAVDVLSSIVQPPLLFE